MTHRMQVPLSAIPLEGMLFQDNWLTRADGLKGKLFAISHHDGGTKVDTILTLRWNDGGITKVEIVQYPTECDDITVDFSMYTPVHRSYSQYQIDRLDKFQSFWKSITEK